MRLFNSKRNNLRRFKFSLWGNGRAISLGIGNAKYSDVIYSSILELILEGLQNTKLFNETNSNSKLFTSFNSLFRDEHQKILIDLLELGEVFFLLEDDTITISDNNNFNFRLTSNTYKGFGKSDFSILKDVLKYIDNILNASNTSIKRMGVLPIFTPKSEFPIDLTDDELKEYEKDISTDYGILEDQTPVKFMRRPFDIATISLGGADLKYDMRLQTAIKIVCSKLRVPYELLPAAIIGNPNQSGIYQEMALIRLYNTVESYVKMFVNLAERLGLTLSYDILTKPKKDEKVVWETKEKMAITLEKLMSLNLITQEEARDEVKNHFDNII